MKASHLTIIALSVLSCSSDGGTGPKEPEKPVAGKPAAAQIMRGNSQAGVVGAQLSDTLILAVRDSQNRPVPNAVIAWVGQGQPFVSASATNASGEARNFWTLGTSAGSQTLEARWIDPETGTAVVLAVFNAVANPGPVYSVSFPVADTFFFLNERISLNSLGMIAQDAFGNVIPTPNVTLTTPPGIAAVGDTIAAEFETEGLVIIDAARSDTVRVAFLHDLRPYRWRTTYTCYDAPSPFRDDNPAARLDSTRYEFTSDSIVYLSRFTNANDFGAAISIRGQQLYTMWWDDGVEITGNRPNSIQRAGHFVGRLYYLDVFESFVDPQRNAPLESGNPRTYTLPAAQPVLVGGVWCPDGFRGRSPVSLRAQ